MSSLESSHPARVNAQALDLPIYHDKADITEDSPSYNQVMASITLSNTTLQTIIGNLERMLERDITHRLKNSRPNLIINNSSLDLCYTQLANFMSLGKHIRPHCAWAGWLIASPTLPTPANLSQLAHLGAACEFLHACALIHDDVIDQSSTRRSQATVHEAFIQLHREEISSNAQTSESESSIRRHFGYSMAILVGDLALSLANQEIASLQPHSSLWQKWNAMEYEVIAGQILDISVAAEGIREIDTASLVNYLKTASYTFIRPLQLGAILASASEKILTILSDLGCALGAAFQLQDDLLGIFSLSPITGKVQGDDLIAGKATVLLTEALNLAQQNSDTQIFRFLDESIGNITDKSHLEQVIQVLVDLGAKEKVEIRIKEYFVQVYDYVQQLRASAECNSFGVDFLYHIITLLEKRTA